MENQDTIYLIGCGVLGPEIKHISQALSFKLKLIFLPGRLHDTPEILRTTLQEAIDEASEDRHCKRIIIGYGLCGRGTVGVTSSSVPLVFPKVHDCIALFLGSDKNYKEQFSKYPGTFYITEGWYNEKKNRKASTGNRVWVGTHSIGCAELNTLYGEKNGKAISQFFNSWKSHYQRAAYIDTGVGNRKRSFDSAVSMARENNWKFQKIPGDLSLLKKLLLHQKSDLDILYVPPGHITIYSATDDCLTCAPRESARLGAKNPLRHLHIQGSKSEGKRSKTVRYGLGIDAGGTYTDGIIYDFQEKKILEKHKALTTKWDFSIGIKKCLNGLSPNAVREVGRVSVSTTLATNAIVEGVGQKTGLLIMNGETSDNQISHSPKCCIKGSLAINGVEREAVDEDEVVKVILKMIEQDGVTAFAVSGFAGSINPSHECQVRDIIKRETGMTVCCGHELSSQLNFITRAQTAVINGRIIPKVINFFKDLDRVLHHFKISAPVMVVKGDGTLMSQSMAMEKPVETILSGPAASVAGARCITGIKNALVVDIGGTTTDTGDIINGAVATSINGASVGRIQTHVQALQMKTVGLGGDSHIRFAEGKFIIGPRRVAPLVWADEVAEGGIGVALAAMRLRPIHRQQQIILVGIEGDFNFEPSEDEKKIYSLLLQRSMPPEQLAAEMSILSPALLKLERLEEKGLVQRCGLTPTDILHVNGSFQKWSPSPASHYLAYLSESLDYSIEALTTQLLNDIVSKLAEELLNSSVFKDFNESDLTNNPLHAHLVEGFLQPQKSRYRLKTAFPYPIIGIGAPVQYFLPQAGEILSTKVIIPEDGDVANAIGAITSQIAVHRSISIEPRGSSYSIKGVADSPLFLTIKEAEEWAIEYLKMNLRESGRKAGTLADDLDIKIEDSTSVLKDGGTLFLGRRISASLMGRPEQPS